MPKVMTCHAKVANQCSPPMGPFWECPRCNLHICNNCKASRPSNQCPGCKKPVTLVRLQ